MYLAFHSTFPPTIHRMLLMPFTYSVWFAVWLDHISLPLFATFTLDWHTLLDFWEWKCRYIIGFQLLMFYSSFVAWLHSFLSESHLNRQWETWKCWFVFFSRYVLNLFWNVAIDNWLFLSSLTCLHCFWWTDRNPEGKEDHLERSEFLSWNVSMNWIGIIPWISSFYGLLFHLWNPV